MKTITTISRKLLVMMIAIITSFIIWAQDTMSSKQNVEKEQYEQILIKEEPNPYFRIEIADSLSNIGNVYYNKSDYENARLYYCIAESEYRILGVLTKRADMLYHIGDCCSRLENNNSNSEITIDTSNHEYTPIYIDGYIYENMYTNYDEGAIYFYEEAKKIYNDLNLNRDNKYAELLTKMGCCYSKKEDYENAIFFYDEALKIYNDLGDKAKNADILSKIGDNYSQKVLNESYKDNVRIKGDFEIARNYYYKALNIYRALQNEPKAAEICSKIGDCFYSVREFRKAITYYNEAIKKCNDNQSAANILLKIVSCYCKEGDYENAIMYYNEAEKRSGTSDDYVEKSAEMLSEIGNCFFWQNLYNNAIIYYYKAREKYSSLGDEYYEYFGAAKMLLNIGDSFSYQEEYKKARESYCEAKKLFIIMNEKFIDNYKVENAAALYRILECNEKISKTYYDECDYKNAIEAYKNVINEYQNYYNRFSNNITVEFLAIIGDCYFHQGKYFEAIKSYEDAIEIYLKNEDDEGYMLECAKLYEKIGNCHILNKNYNDAKKVFGDAEEIYKSLDKKDWPEYVSLLEGYARLYYFQDQPSIAYYYIQQALNINDSIVLNELKSLTTTERTSYWEKNSYYYFSSLPNIAIALDNNTVTRDLYNKSALFAKGLLMTSGNEIKRVIYDSGNEDLIKAYNELQDTRARIKALLEKSEDDKKNIIERLEEEAEKQEKNLLEWMVLLNKWDECSDFTENLQLTWNDVQAKLGDNDIAIEFLSFPKLGDENSTMYLALTVRPGQEYDQPHMIELCEEKDLIAAKENAYTGPELSKLIWKELADAGELKGVDNIYFSPSGLLHTIAIESVPHWSKKGVMMSDTFNIYRLSSTRELALKRKMVDGANGASVYGGISYNAPVEVMGTPRFGGRETYFAAADLPSPEVMPTQNNQNRAYHVVELEDGTRALQWDSLPGSSEEAIAVTSLLESKMDTHLMTDLVATEASFKELSGQKRKLIHIATHGFYWSDSTALRHKQMVLIPSNYEKMQEQDKSMVRSGLLFSGAQNTFFHKVIPEGVDDGILTAQEVSNIDLRGLDLVVLSACQTALGEISGEGVFGLQRGFKMAGAQSIIMSLWSVSDKATQDMMTEFYKAYNPDINNKREAFFIAQKFVKEHDSDYTYSNDEDEDQELRKTHPHWAAFILLDALD